MLGQKVASVESTNQFDVTSLSSGNYIVKIVGCAKGRSLNGVLSGSYRGYPVKSPPGGRYKSVWSTNLPIKTEALEARAPVWYDCYAFAVEACHMASLDISGFAQNVVGHCVGRSCGGIGDGAKVLLVFLNVVGQSIKQAFGMNRVHDDTAADVGIGGAGEHLGEIKNHLGGAVRDDGEVAIGACCHIGGDVELEVFDWVVIVCHDFWFLS